MRDLAEILSNQNLELSIRGKTYLIEPIGHQDGLRLKLLGEQDSGVNMTDDDALRMLLGPALDEMRADNVPDAWILRAALTAQADALTGRTVAEMVWENGPDPEALAAQVAAATGQATNRATRRAAASSTRSRASGSGTSTARKASRPSKTTGAGRK